MASKLAIHSNGAMEEKQVTLRVRTLPQTPRNSPVDAALVEEFGRLERRIFPKHESLASSFSQEVKKRNQILLYSLQGDESTKGEDEKETIDPATVAGYLMYSWTSLAASITKLAVRESCRRQGYGEALLKSAVHQIRARRLQCINLHVDQTRTAAVALYKKLGFCIETVVHSYYAPDRDAYRMVLELTPTGAV